MIKTKYCRLCDEWHHAKSVAGTAWYNTISEILALCRFKALTVFHVKHIALVRNSVKCERKERRQRTEGVHVPWAGHVRHRTSPSAQGRLSHSCSSCFRPHWALMDAVLWFGGLKGTAGEPPVCVLSPRQWSPAGGQSCTLHSHPAAEHNNTTQLKGGGYEGTVIDFWWLHSAVHQQNYTDQYIK